MTVRQTITITTLILISAWLGCAGVGSSGDKAMESWATSDSWADTGGEAGFGGFDAPMEEEMLKADEDDGLAYRGVEDLVQVDSKGTGAKVERAVEGRKLIYTGNISVMVDEFEPFRKSLDTKLEEIGGFVSDESLDHYSGHVGWATVTVRVPAERFDDLVDWTENEVEITSKNVSTQDVTEEWVDIRSRIDNWKRTEERLLRILEDETATLADVLAVEHELSRVRQEIERAEGRMRVLADQVELATLTISVSVRNPYEPTVEPPGFGQNIATVFKESIAAMFTVAKGGVLVLVALAPWLLVMFVFCYIVYRIIRGAIRRKSA